LLCKRSNFGKEHLENALALLKMQGAPSPMEKMEEKLQQETQSIKRLSPKIWKN
jgi:hypothetical protein